MNCCDLPIQKGVLILFALVFASCSLDRDIDQAEESLEGSWEIRAITSRFGEFFERGSNVTDVVEESGSLGSFIFNGNTVDFDFTRNDSLFMGNTSWDLDARRIRSGFSRETEFTLEMDGFFVFDASFGNSTRNSERNATTLLLTEIPPLGNGVSIELELVKN